MKVLKSIFLLFLLCAAAYSQTQDLGMGAFANEHGAILVVVDAALVDFQIKRPYVMFVIYMAAKNQNQDIVVGRDTIAMVFQGKEYKMPSLKELGQNYQGEIHDINFYRNLSKESVIASWARFYNFPQDIDFYRHLGKEGVIASDFFPPNTLSAPLPVDEASMYSFRGFRTKAYFKNPGFKMGDKVTFKVWDKKDPKLSAEVEVVLK